MPETLDPKYIGIGMALGSGIGVAVGAAIGAATGEMGTWIALGVPMGVAGEFHFVRRGGGGRDRRARRRPGVRPDRRTGAGAAGTLDITGGFIGIMGPHMAARLSSRRDVPDNNID